MFDMDIDFGINKDNDGIDHINVYSRGKTYLGRWLSNFQYSPFEHPHDGCFISIEGYWYWLKTGKVHDSLRTLHGIEAKREGRKYRQVMIDVDEHRERIKEAMCLKLVNSPVMIEQLRNSHLPFYHYYVYQDMVQVVEGSEWQMDEWERLRAIIK